MRKKSQLDIGEFSPMAAALGLVGGILSLVVMSQVEVGLIWRIGAFVGSTIACYLIASFIANK